MRIIAAIVIAALLAPAALAQDLTPQQLQDEHYAALQERDRLAAAANAAVDARDMRLACMRSKDAVFQGLKASRRLEELRDAVGSQIEPAMLEAMSATLKRLFMENSQMSQTSDNVCKQANKPS